MPLSSISSSHNFEIVVQETPIYQAGMRISKEIPIKYPLGLVHYSPPMDASAPLNE